MKTIEQVCKYLIIGIVTLFILLTPAFGGLFIAYNIICKIDDKHRGFVTNHWYSVMAIILIVVFSHMIILGSIVHNFNN